MPFPDLQTDPVTGETAGLLDRARRNSAAPKLFHVISAFEYWTARPRSSTPTRPARMPPLAETGRICFIASAQHGPGSLPPSDGRGASGNGGAQPREPERLPPGAAGARARARRVGRPRRGTARNRYPKLADGTLAPPERAGWPALRGVTFPLGSRNEPRGWTRPRLGPRRDHGRSRPDRRGVPRAGAGGGRRRQRPRPDSACPRSRCRSRRRPAGTRATRRRARRTPLAGVSARIFPFARNRAAREASGDPRPSIEERYADRASYLGRIAEAALALQRERLLLAEDVPFVLERAAAHWDWRAGRP